MKGIWINIVTTENIITGLNLWGVTLGAEYKPTDNSYIRLEARQLQTESSQKIFHWKNEDTNSRLEMMLHLGVSF